MLKKDTEMMLKMLDKAIEEDKLPFACCFCHQGVTFQDPDFLDIVITANPDKPKNQQADQFFWGHAPCLKNKLHKNLIKKLFQFEN